MCVRVCFILQYSSVNFSLQIVLFNLTRWYSFELSPFIFFFFLFLYVQQLILSLASTKHFFHSPPSILSPFLYYSLTCLGLFHAAKNYEQVALLCKETKHFEQAAELMEKSASMFVEHGTPDSARLVLEKGGKMVEKELPLKAVHLYKKASAIADNEDRPNNAAENIGKCARILINERKLDQAMECLKKEIAFHERSQSYPMIGKSVTGIILVYLHNDDFAAAYAFYEKSFK
ncbi:NAPG [Acanthosepion pharaonis]|uniref:Gamma-soluble NSF attachment protein n=1 Tax=Acanthosepion pharaonis TaxID=158019 RepID=A0A812CX80_ACAPH|nr:NAPG [Sepia pharaonis]